MKHLKRSLASILRKWAFALNPEHPLRENEESAKVKNQSSPEARLAAPVTRTVVEIPNFIAEEYFRTNKEQEAENRANTTTAKWAVRVAAFLAAIGIWQASLTRIANEDNRKFFEMTRQPSIGLEVRNNQIIEFVRNANKGFVIMHFKNFGQGRAKKVFAQMWPEFGKQYSQDIPALSYPEVQRFGGTTVPPGTSYDFQQTINLADFTKVTNGQEDIIIAGRVTYEDEFKRQLCEAVCVDYEPDVMPFPALCFFHADYCDGQPHTVSSIATAIPEQPGNLRTPAPGQAYERFYTR